MQQGSRNQFQQNPWNRSSIYNGEKDVYGIDIAPLSIWLLGEFYLWEQSLFLSGINTVEKELLLTSTISEEN